MLNSSRRALFFRYFSVLNQKIGNHKLFFVQQTKDSYALAIFRFLVRHIFFICINVEPEREKVLKFADEGST